MLEGLSIDRPCDADPEQIAGGFCRRCGKQVHDLSALTRPEAERLVAEAPGKICARIQRRADGTVVTLAAMLLASASAHADLTTRGKKQTRKPTVLPRVEPPVGELIEHVPHAPEDVRSTVMGELSVNAFRPALEGLKRCYQKVVKRAPNLAGKLGLRLKVAKGRVESVEIVDSNLDDSELEHCILEVARSWQFPESEAIITITYPMIFSPP